MIKIYKFITLIIDAISSVLELLLGLRFILKLLDASEDNYFVKGIYLYSDKILNKFNFNLFTPVDRKSVV